MNLVLVFALMLLVIVALKWSESRELIGRVAAAAMRLPLPLSARSMVIMVFVVHEFVHDVAMYAWAVPAYQTIRACDEIDQRMIADIGIGDTERIEQDQRNWQRCAETAQALSRVGEAVLHVH